MLVRSPPSVLTSEMEKPADVVGTRKVVRPRCFFASVLVRVSTNT